MKNRNICKFIPGSAEHTLITTKFIFETEWCGDSEEQIADTNRMMLITSGTGVYSANGVTHRLEHGNAVFILAGQTYLLKNENGLQYLYIDYYGEQSNGLHARFGITEEHCVFETDKSLISIWKESLIRASNENIDLLSKSMLLYAFSQLHKAEEPTTETIQAVIEYISENYGDAALSLVKTAEALGYNSKYLSHLIVKKLGVSFSQYVTELRLRQSVILINEGLTSVKNISILCGFSDPFYFSKVFKQKFNTSPKSFIEEKNRFHS